MKERIAIIDGLRTPFSKSGQTLKKISAHDLGAIVVRELMARLDYSPEAVDELIIGNVAQPAEAANIARVVALKAGLPTSMVAYTVHRNCASGMQSITAAANKILAGEASVILAGGTESMSQIPFFYPQVMSDWFMRFFKSRTAIKKMQALLSFRLRYLKPVIGIELGLTDPVCGLNMGHTAEVLAKEFQISREEQDIFALLSHQKAVAAIQSGKLAEEIIPIALAPHYDKVMTQDDGPRESQSIEQLTKLRPFFNRKTGTVTVGNACPITDGAAAVLCMTESRAKEEGLVPLGYLRGYAYAALEGNRMGLGPVYATSKLLDKTGLTMKDFERVEINEAFAVQVIANERAFGSLEFAKQYLGKASAVGQLDRELLNVNGGAIALGHPVGATGTRLVITMLKELRRQNKNLGLATLCIGGGQGAAMALEVA